MVPRRPLARARRRARVPALADPRQGRLLDQGRARLPAPGRLRPARLREPHPVAARRPGRHRRGVGVGEDRLVRRAPVRRLRRRCATPRHGRRPLFRTDYAIPRLLVSWALRFGDQARVCRPARARRGVARAAGPDHRAPPRRAVHLRRRRPPPAAAAPEGEAAGRSRGGEAGDPARALRAPRHARHRADRRRPRGPPAAGRRGPRAAADLRRRSCARTSPCSTSSTSAAAPT